MIKLHLSLNMNTGILPEATLRHTFLSRYQNLKLTASHGKYHFLVYIKRTMQPAVHRREAAKQQSAHIYAIQQFFHGICFELLLRSYAPLRSDTSPDTQYNKLYPASSHSTLFRDEHPNINVVGQIIMLRRYLVMSLAYRFLQLMHRHSHLSSLQVPWAPFTRYVRESRREKRVI